MNFRAFTLGFFLNGSLSEALSTEYPVLVLSRTSVQELKLPPLHFSRSFVSAETVSPQKTPEQSPEKVYTPLEVTSPTQLQHSGIQSADYSPAALTICDSGAETEELPFCDTISPLQGTSAISIGQSSSKTTHTEPIIEPELQVAQDKSFSPSEITLGSLTGQTRIMNLAEPPASNEEGEVGEIHLLQSTLPLQQREAVTMLP